MTMLVIVSVVTINDNTYSC